MGGYSARCLARRTGRRDRVFLMGTLPAVTTRDGVGDPQSWSVRSTPLSGISNGKMGIFSCWVTVEENPGATIRFLLRSTAVSAFDNRFWIGSSPGSNDLRIQSQANGVEAELSLSTGFGSFAAAPGFYHILSSWNTANDFGEIYINDVNETLSSVITPADVLLEYDNPMWTIGAGDGFTSGGVQKIPLTSTFFWCMSHMYLNLEEWLDITVEANRRKFITSDLKPATALSESSDGSPPTGNAPAIFFNNSNFTTNAGTAGNFALGTSAVAFDPCDTSPPDFDDSSTPLAVTKIFDPANTATGERAKITLTLDNTANSGDAENISFTDSLPSGLVVATPSVTANNCGGTLTAVAGSGTFSLVGGTILAGESKTIEVDVESQTPGTYNNSVTVTSDFGDSDPASDSIIYSQDMIYLSADEHLAYRPDERIYNSPTTRSPRSGVLLKSKLQMLRELNDETDYSEPEVF
jgi:uncharacterized repeat protein (TIGR01451 family)